LGLTTGLESREKVDKKEKTFLKKVLTRRMSPEYNRVSQGDTPSPPWGGGGGATVVPSGLARFMLRRLY